MKNLFLAIALLLLLPVAAVAAPKISVTLPVYDFGTVTEGFAVSYSFVIQNVGDETLEISGVSASCGCTTAALSKTSIAPGESVDLETLVNTTGFHGTISKSVSVYSNDPEMPILSLRITGQVISAEVYHIAASDAFYYLYLAVDLRSTEEYEAHHLLGAVNIPLASLEDEVTSLPKGAFIVLYDAVFETSEDAALLMRDRGFYTTYALVGGLNEWVHRFGSRHLTHPEEPYTLSPQTTYAYDSGQRPRHLMLFDELDSIFLLYIDVRSPEEYAAGHILGAINIPFGELSAWIDVLPRTVPLITYDQAGTLGDEAARWLLNNDFPGAQSMLGGLDEWIRQYGTEYLLPSSS